MLRHLCTWYKGTKQGVSHDPHLSGISTSRLLVLQEYEQMPFFMAGFNETSDMPLKIIQVTHMNSMQGSHKGAQNPA